jgi:hypothetical protein
MTPIAEALKKEEHLSDKKDYWENELKSLGIEQRGGASGIGRNH